VVGGRVDDGQVDGQVGRQAGTQAQQVGKNFSGKAGWQGNTGTAGEWEQGPGAGKAHQLFYDPNKPATGPPQPRRTAASETTHHPHVTHPQHAACHLPLCISTTHLVVLADVRCIQDVP